MKLEDITSFEEKHKYLEENLQDDMYVRTSDNGIDKFKFKLKNDGKPFYTYYFEKTSISGTRYDKSDLHCYCDYCQNEKTGKWLMIPAKDIKSIVTKEQMKAMEYKVVE